MTESLLVLRLEELLFDHDEVARKKVGRYIMRFASGEHVDPISVTYCVHTGKYMVDNGHHRAVAAHFLKMTYILAKTEPCYIYNCKGLEPDIQFYHIRHTKS